MISIAQNSAKKNTSSILGEGLDTRPIGPIETRTSSTSQRLKVLGWRKLHDCMCMLDEHSSSTNVVAIRINVVVKNESYCMIYPYAMMSGTSSPAMEGLSHASARASLILFCRSTTQTSHRLWTTLSSRIRTRPRRRPRDRRSGAGWPSTERGRRPGHGDVTGDCRKTVRVLSG